MGGVASPMLMTGELARSTRTTGPRARLVLPVVVLATTSYAVPLIAPLITSGTLASDLASTENTQITSLIAAVSTLLIFHRITAYPGTRAFGFILPAFSTTRSVTSPRRRSNRAAAGHRHRRRRPAAYHALRGRARAS